MESIHFFSEDIDFELSHTSPITTWIKEVIELEKRQVAGLNFVFCSDKYLVQLNQQYLNREYLTDVITFDNSESEEIQGDVYISIQRVRENSTLFEDGFHRELARVMIHGVLHLLGFKDGSDKQKQLMRKKEEASLSLLPLP